MSSSLEKLVEDIIKESQAKAEEVRKQGLSQVEETIAHAKAEAIREADQITRNVKAEADAVRNRVVSQARQKARLAHLAERNRIVREVLKDVRTGLLEFARDARAYRPFLLKAIALGVEAVPSESVKVALSERDLERFNGTKLFEDALFTAQSRTRKVTVSEEPIQTIGGAVVMSEDGKIRAHCTFEAKLELMESQLLAELAKILFGP